MHQPVRLAYAFGVKRNHLGGRIVHHHLDHVAQRQVRFVARHHDGRQTQSVLPGKCHEVRAVGTGLADDGDLASGRKSHFHAGGERRIQMASWVDEAKGIGAKQPHAVTARGLDDFLLRGCPRLADFRKAGRKQNTDCRAALTQGLYGIAHQVCRHGDDGHIRRDRQCVDGGIARQPLNLLAIGINREYLSLVTLTQHVGNGATADAQRIVGGADHGDG